MCGHITILGPSFSNRKQIEISLTRMKNRGPDDEGLIFENEHQLFMGHRRLSINDLSEKGRQPFWSPNKNLLLVCNGEIYNYPILKNELEAKGYHFKSKSDSEVILHAYSEWGEDCFNKFEGIFAFTLYDLEKKTLFAVRDHLGIKPLFYTNRDSNIVISSELRAINAIFNDQISLDKKGIAYLLSICHVPPPYSIYDQVKKVKPGHYLKIFGGNITEIKYWEIPKFETPQTTPWAEIFGNVVKEQMLSDVDVGIFLSGGIDSSALAVACKNYGAKGLTLSFPESELDEGPIASSTASKLGIDYISEECYHKDIDQTISKVASELDEPFGFSSVMATYEISRIAQKNNLKVVLCGSGGDECFAGYRWHYWKNSNLNPYLLKIMHRANKNFINLHNKDSLLDDYIIGSCTRFLPESIQTLLGIRFSRDDWREPYWDYFHNNELPIHKKIQRVDLMTFCAAINLQMLDQTSMIHSLEARVPFLDRRIISWAIQNPSVHPSTPSKHTLREYLGNQVDERVLNLEKKGFRFLGFEHQAKLKSKWISEISNSNLQRDYLEHKKLNQYNLNQLLSLIILSRWYDSKC